MHYANALTAVNSEGCGFSTPRFRRFDVDMGHTIVSVIPVADILLYVRAGGCVAYTVVVDDCSTVVVYRFRGHGSEHIDGIGVTVLREFGNGLIARYMREFWRPVVTGIKIELLFEITLGVMGG
jgi:hypothetical protein